MIVDISFDDGLTYHIFIIRHNHSSLLVLAGAVARAELWLSDDYILLLVFNSKYLKLAVIYPNNELY